MQTDVLIVGAGPTGLALAGQCLRYGIDFVIVEKNSGLTPHSNAVAVHARTLEMYEQIGLARAAVAQGAVGAKVRLLEGGAVRGEVDLRQAGGGMSPFPFVLLLEQSKNEALLHDYLASRGKSVVWKTELQSLTQTYTGVTARVKNRDNHEYEISAKYLVGCDGSHSPVRHALGLTFSGSASERLYYVADVALDTELPHDTLHLCLVPDSLIALLPMPGDTNNRWRIVGAFPEGFDPRPDPQRDTQPDTRARIETHIHREAGIALRISAVDWFSAYTVRSRHVDRFSEGRCFLAGDAAHSHTPTGGQGMNTGIGDAYNLAWKLALVLKGQANARILDTYNQERLENARRLLQTTDRMGAASGSESRPGPGPGPDWLLGFLRTTIYPPFARNVAGSESVRSRFFAMLSQIGSHYRDSELSEHTGEAGFAAVAGDRLPFCTVDNQSLQARLHAPKFHLLHFTTDGAPGDAPYETDHDAVAGEFDTLLDQHALALTPVVADAFGTEASFSVLVRPDGHVALFCRKNVHKAIQSYVTEHLGEIDLRPGRRDRRGAMLHPLTRGLLLTALAGAPAVAEGLLARLGGTHDPRWETRLSPERPTLREITAHLADRETVWNESVRRMLEKDNPDLPDADEARVAPGEANSIHDTGNMRDNQDPHENLRRFRRERAALMDTLRALSEREWPRTGLIRAFLPMTIERLAVHISGHDGSYAAQIAESLGKNPPEAL